MLVAVAVVLVGAGLAVAAYTIFSPRLAPTGVSRSLELARAPLQVPDAVPLSERPASDRLWRPLLLGLAKLGARITPVGTPQRLRRRLDLAGNTPPWDLESILVIKAVGTFGLGGLGLVIWLASRSPKGLLLLGLLAALGYWVADLLLYNMGLKRQEAMRRAAPDALDMLTICVEAGLGFDAGLAQVAENTTGPLAAEFTRVLKEVRLGRSRSQAFGDLAERTDVTEVKSFVAALVQADRLGVPIAGVLREQAAELRVRRRQRAEEKAQKVPVKIIFPVLFCIFPVFFIIVIGPGAIRIAQVFVHG
jgi:tight adherence protein C